MTFNLVWNGLNYPVIDILTKFRSVLVGMYATYADWLNLSNFNQSTIFHDHIPLSSVVAFLIPDTVEFRQPRLLTRMNVIKHK